MKNENETIHPLSTSDSKASEVDKAECNVTTESKVTTNDNHLNESKHGTVFGPSTGATKNAHHAPSYADTAKKSTSENVSSNTRAKS